MSHCSTSVLQFNKNYDEAIIIYKKCVDLQVNFSMIYYKLAECYEENLQLNKAIATLNKALKLNPDLKIYLDYAEKLKELADFFDEFFFRSRPNYSY